MFYFVFFFFFVKFCEKFVWERELFEFEEASANKLRDLRCFRVMIVFPTRPMRTLRRIGMKIVASCSSFETEETFPLAKRCAIDSFRVMRVSSSANETSA